METEFNMGQVLSKSYEIFARYFPFMLIIAFMVTLPGYLAHLTPHTFLTVPLTFLGIMFMNLLAQGIVVYGVFQHLTNQPVDFSRSLSVALNRFLSLLLVAVAVGLITGLGFLMLVIPGLIVLTILWVAVPVTIVEQGGIIYALQRSKDLTTGFRGRIFSIVVTLSLISAMVSIIQGKLLAALGLGMDSSFTSVLLIQYPLTALGSGSVSAFSSIAVTVGYYMLRQENEGISPEDFSTAFK